MLSAPLARWSLLQIWLIWWFQDKLLSMRTPRYFTALLGKIRWPWILILISKLVNLRLGWNIKSSVFVEFNDIKLALSQLTRSLRSILIFFAKDFKELLLRKSIVSSAKRLTIEYKIAAWRSFTYKRKRRGPRTDPWGTPWDTNFESDLAPLISTYCFLEVKKDLNQDWVIPRIP